MYDAKPSPAVKEALDNIQERLDFLKGSRKKLDSEIEARKKLNEEARAEGKEPTANVPKKGKSQPRIFSGLSSEEQNILGKIRRGAEETETAERILPTETSNPLKGAVIGLGKNIGSQRDIENVGRGLEKSAAGIGGYLFSKNSIEDTKTALEGIREVVEAREDLSDSDKEALLNQIDTDLAKIGDPTQYTQSAKSHLSEATQARDTEQHEKDVDKALNDFDKTVNDVTDEQEITPIDTKKDEEDTERADAKYKERLKYAEQKLSDWYRSSGMHKVLSGLNADLALQDIAEAVVGNTRENFKMDSTPANTVLTRLGSAIYDTLKAQGKDTSYFDNLPPKLERYFIEELGMVVDEIQRRAKNFRFLEAGGSAMELLGGVDGFIEYGRGHYSAGRRMDLRFNITNLNQLESLGLGDKLADLLTAGAIDMPNDWLTMERIPLTIVDKEQFDLTMRRDDLENTKVGDGFKKFQELLKNKGIVEKAADWNEKEVTTVRVTDSQALDDFILGAINAGSTADPNDASARKPQTVKR